MILILSHELRHQKSLNPNVGKQAQLANFIKLSSTISCIYKERKLVSKPSQ